VKNEIVNTVIRHVIHRNKKEKVATTCARKQNHFFVPYFINYTFSTALVLERRKERQL